MLGELFVGQPPGREGLLLDGVLRHASQPREARPAGRRQVEAGGRLYGRALRRVRVAVMVDAALQSARFSIDT